MPWHEPGLPTLHLLLDDVKRVETILERVVTELKQLDEIRDEELKFFFMKERLSEAIARLGQLEEFIETVSHEHQPQLNE